MPASNSAEIVSELLRYGAVPHLPKNGMGAVPRRFVSSNRWFLALSLPPLSIRFCDQYSDYKYQ